MSADTSLAFAHIELDATHYRDLRIAVELLERPRFVARLADYAGQPIDAVVRLMPRAINRSLKEVVRSAIFGCLKLAVNSLEDGGGAAKGAPPASPWTDKVVTGLTGGIGGFFGMAALPIELPLTTTLMLRSVAEIARSEGEDLKSLETRLACVEVFALGARGTSGMVNVDYYAVRTVLAKLSAEVAAYVMERGAINASSPIIARLVGEIVGRFGLAVSDRIVAGAAPLFGVFGGATVNMIFTDHFQRVARGHFTVRRLERIYDTDSIQALYHQLAREMNARRSRYRSGIE